MGPLLDAASIARLLCSLIENPLLDAAFIARFQSDGFQSHRKVIATREFQSQVIARRVAITKAIATRLYVYNMPPPKEHMGMRLAGTHFAPTQI